ncbi:MAG: NAD(P)/FAD-dependent oxidoreductase, partial [Steroidobacteraceae bacterium]|nr:NAD(P)/FAD-dependent oxidoreductase [Steroidobacteraceae bacterium]
MTRAAPIVVIGAGHNGLVCATYLARAGRKVILIEAREEVGGAAVTQEFYPGFRISRVAHLLYQLEPRIERELELARHGLRIARAHLRTVALSTERAALVLDGPHILRGDVPPGERDAYARWYLERTRFARFVGRQHERIPPRLRFGTWRERIEVAPLLWDLRPLGRDGMRDFLRVATMSIDDWLREYCSDPLLQGALALDGLLGTRLGPSSGGSVYSCWQRASVGLSGAGGYRLPRGGIGAVSDALLGAARAAGIELRLGQRASALDVAGGRVVGVRLANGASVACSAVVAAVHPRTALLELLGARHLDIEFARRVQRLRSVGTAAKLHLALASLPRFAGVDAADLGERLVIAPDLEYIQRAFNAAKYRRQATEPVFEITLPSVHDPSLAPPGMHVLSAIVQYAPYDLAAGWPGARAAFL